MKEERNMKKVRKAGRKKERNKTPVIPGLKSPSHPAHFLHSIPTPTPKKKTLGDSSKYRPYPPSR